MDIIAFHFVVFTEVVLECPQHFNATTSEGLRFASSVTWPLPTIHGTSAQLHLESNRQRGDSFELGLHEIMYTATYGSSLTVECNFTLYIYGKYTFSYWIIIPIDPKNINVKSESAWNCAKM